jgi:putative transposase
VQKTNHVHLFLTPPSPTAVPQLLSSLGRRYVQSINTTYRRTGTLRDSRYKSSLVHAGTYLLQCQRYIELSPVRAGMVDDPAYFRWSSYRANGLGQPDPLLTPHPLYTALGRAEPERLDAYRSIFRSELDADAINDIRVALNQGQPLGNSRFVDQIEKATGQRREVRPRGRPKKIVDSRD